MGVGMGPPTLSEGLISLFSLIALFAYAAGWYPKQKPFPGGRGSTAFASASKRLRVRKDKSVPQGLKPSSIRFFYGTPEPVPFVESTLPRQAGPASVACYPKP